MSNTFTHQGQVHLNICIFMFLLKDAKVLTLLMVCSNLLKYWAPRYLRLHWLLERQYFGNLMMLSLLERVLMLWASCTYMNILLIPSVELPFKPLNTILHEWAALQSDRKGILVLWWRSRTGVVGSALQQIRRHPFWISCSVRQISIVLASRHSLSF